MSAKGWDYIVVGAGAAGCVVTSAKFRLYCPGAGRSVARFVGGLLVSHLLPLYMLPIEIR